MTVQRIDQICRLLAGITPGNWRTGSVGRTIYKNYSPTPDDLIGVMVTREDAAFVAAAPGIIRELINAVTPEE